MLIFLCFKLCCITDAGKGLAQNTTSLSPTLDSRSGYLSTEIWRFRSEADFAAGGLQTII